MINELTLSGLSVGSGNGFNSQEQFQFGSVASNVLTPTPEAPPVEQSNCYVTWQGNPG